MEELVAEVNRVRSLRGFLSLQETVLLGTRGNIVFDPWSTLISIDAEIGMDNIFHPNILIETQQDGRIRIGNANSFQSGVILGAAVDGEIVLGDGNELGEGGVVMRANRAGSFVRVGSNGRFLNGPQIMGRSTLGDGTQILGSITVQDCTLDGGESYKHPDAGLRAGLLKGSGLARGLTVGQGQVINGLGTFSADMVELQSAYH